MRLAKDGFYSFSKAIEKSCEPEATNMKVATRKHLRTADPKRFGIAGKMRTRVNKRYPGNSSKPAIYRSKKIN